MAHRPHLSWFRPLRAAAAVLLAATAIVGTGNATGAASRVDSDRLWGADRYETAAEIAEEYAAAAGPIDTAIVASGESFADALAATPLARVRNAPILLSPPDELHPATRSFIQRHRIDDIIIAGGTTAISDDVEDALAALISGRPERLEGSDRYRTVVNIAREIEVREIGDYCGDGRRTALLATGEKFADALALSPLAFSGPHPVLLTEPDRLPASVRNYFVDYTIEQVVIAGGTAAIADSVEAEISDLGIRVERLWGRDRFETAVEIADALADRCFGSDEFGLADGRKFPDALVGGPLLGLRRAPLLLSEPALPDATRRFLAGPVPDASTVQLTIFGGPAAVSDSAAAAATDALRGLDRECDPRTDAPGVPRDVTVQPLNGALQIRWDAPAAVGSSGPDGFRIRYRPVGGQWITMRNVSSPATISGLQNTALYEVQVRADGSGYEVWSPSSYATPSDAAGVAAQSAPGSTSRSLRAAAVSPAAGQQANTAAPDCPPGPASA
ncbi:cell wall-binding repeat-containing protein [Candidatus Poriferisodalis sp.]|uniref:cell wall-binding repeat-containing protein n=1 Tax=Candidatus Poriferisodalis sp. TaxID=3101277 RepID=UPI003B5BD0A0